jgi:hypothetical protein
MALPKWITLAGQLGIVPETEYYEYDLDAYDASGGTLVYSHISGKLPLGIQLIPTGKLQGIPISELGGPDQNVTYTFTIRVKNSTTNGVADRTFNITVSNVAPPIIIPRDVDLGIYFDGTIVNIQLEAIESTPGANLIWRKKSGDLPPGLSISATGLISGYITPVVAPGPGSNPGWDLTPWSGLGWDFSLIASGKTFVFTVEVTDGVNYDATPYRILILPQGALSADSTLITADTTETGSRILTIDTGSRHEPIIITTQDEIEDQRQGSFFAFQIVGLDLDNDVLQYTLPTITTSAFDPQLDGNGNPYIISTLIDGKLSIGVNSVTDVTSAALLPGDDIKVLSLTTPDELNWYDAEVNSYINLKVTGNKIIDASPGNFVTQAVSSANATIATVSSTSGTIEVSGNIITGSITINGNTNIGTLAVSNSLITANVGDYITQFLSTANASVRANVVNSPSVPIELISGAFTNAIGSNIKINGNFIDAYPISSTYDDILITASVGDLIIQTNTGATATVTANVVSGIIIPVEYTGGTFTIGYGNLSLNAVAVDVYPTSLGILEITPVGVTAITGDIITQASTGANATVTANITSSTVIPVTYNSGTFSTTSGNLTIGATSIKVMPRNIIAYADIGMVYNTASTFTLNSPATSAILNIENSLAGDIVVAIGHIDINGGTITPGNNYIPATSRINNQSLTYSTTMIAYKLSRLSNPENPTAFIGTGGTPNNWGAYSVRLSPNSSVTGSFVGATNDNIISGSATTNSFTINYPSGAITGDLAIVAITATNNLIGGFTAAGWTQADTTTGAINSCLLYKVITDLSAVTFTHVGPTSTCVTASMAVFRNTVYNSFTSATGTSGYPNPPSITTSGVVAINDITGAIPTFVNSVGVTLGSLSHEGTIGYAESKFDQSPLFVPSGLTIDLNSGWMTGQLPAQTANETTYSFEVLVYKRDYQAYQTSQIFTLTVLGDLNNKINWITPSDLGTIENGRVSDLHVSAISTKGKSVRYTLTAGAYQHLPQGLILTNGGLISGRVSFELFSLDQGATFLDGTILGEATTTFDNTYTFTITASDLDISAAADRTFTIRVLNRNKTPYEDLYFKALPSKTQRTQFTSIMNNASIFPPELIYRNEDPFFGIAQDIKLLFLPGLNPSLMSEYATAVSTNHYEKQIRLGDVKTAVARDSNFNIKYEVVYLEVTDDNTNALGQGPANIQYPQIVTPYYDYDNNAYTTAYPNSFNNMKDVTVAALGYANKGALPDWMTSRQADGFITGFTYAVVLAYTIPGASSLIAYRYQQQNFNLNDINFTVDRYQVDNNYTANYNISGNAFITSAETTFDRYPGMSTVFTVNGTVDYGVSIPYENINNRLKLDIVNLGGLDGMTQFKDGETLVFVQQEFRQGQNDIGDYNQGWNNVITVWGGDSWDYDNATVTTSDDLGWDEAGAVLGYNENNLDPSVANKRIGIWRINIAADNMVTLTYVQEITFYNRLYVRNGYTHGQTHIYYDPVIKPGNLIPSYSIIPEKIETISTQFDGNGTRFYSYRNSYTIPGVGDKYIKFSKLGVFN